MHRTNHQCTAPIVLILHDPQSPQSSPEVCPTTPWTRRGDDDHPANVRTTTPPTGDIVVYSLDVRLRIRSQPPFPGAR